MEKRQKSAPRQCEISFASSPQKCSSRNIWLSFPAAIWSATLFTPPPPPLPELMVMLGSWPDVLVRKMSNRRSDKHYHGGLALPNVVEKVYTWICLEASQNTFLMMMILVWFTIGSMLTISALQRRSPPWRSCKPTESVDCPGFT